MQLPEYFVRDPAALYNLYGSILVIIGAGYMLVRRNHNSPLGCYVCICGGVIQCCTAYIKGDVFGWVFMAAVSLLFVWQAWLRIRMENMLKELERMKQQHPDIFK